MEPSIYYRCATCGCVHELYPSDVNVDGGASIECKHCGVVTTGVTRDRCTETPGGEEVDPPRHLAADETRAAFWKDLSEVINRHSMESGSDTPDFILAGFLTTVLIAFDMAIAQRSAWYGHHDSPGVEANVEYTPPPEFSGARFFEPDDGPTVFRCSVVGCGALSLQQHLTENGCQCGGGVSPYYGGAAKQFRSLIHERDRLAAELQGVRD